MSNIFYPLVINHFYAVTAEVCKQTLSESKIEHAISMGSFTVHHGHRDGGPIVIVEHHNQAADELSGIWYDDGM